MITESNKGVYVFESNSCVFYSKVQDGNNKVFSQLLINEFPNIDEMAYIKNDYELSKVIHTDKILHPFQLIQSEEGLYCIKEYFDGIPLSNFIENYALSIPQILKLSIELTELLKELHQHNIIVKEFIIENIIINPDDLKMKFCCLGSATSLSRETLIYNSDFNYFGSFSHLAPEQTGRIGRSLDYRADFYALGVLLYEIACKRKPFTQKDSMDLIYAHIAKNPIEPRFVSEKLPQTFNDLILKLMAKNPEDRYQSDEGILYDLRKCLNDWSKDGDIAYFELGKKDYKTVFSISEEIYGRNRELEILKYAWKETLIGNAKLLLVSGYSGIGKTRLINELTKSIFHSDGYYAAGKYDQYNRDKPFSALAEALNELIKSASQEPRELRDQWSEAINTLSENDLSVLATHLPRLKYFLSEERQKLVDVKVTDTEYSSSKAFISLLEIVGNIDKSLCLFIDDLQWIDSESLEVFKYLATHPIERILFIGAYRDNEVDRSHPLMMLKDETLHDRPDFILELELKDLDLENINLLIADSFQMNPKDTYELTQLVIGNTKGNPFFIRQFLERLVKKDLIQFSHDQKKWEWDAISISEMQVSNYVVDLVLGKMSHLSDKAKDIIKIAACVGNNFELKTIEYVAELDSSSITDGMWELVENEFINPIGQWMQFSSSIANELKNIERPNYRFKFQHDRIQQAAYDLIPDIEKAKTHYEIGSILLKQMQDEAIDENIFELVHHLNIGYDVDQTSKDHDTIIALNLKAGNKALSNNLIRTAKSYFDHGMKMIKGDQSSPDYKEFLIGLSECDYLLGDYEASESRFDEAVKNADSKYLKSEILSKKMALYENTQRHEKAIDTARESLRLLGMKLPEKVKQYHVLQELLKVKFKLRNRKTMSLLEMPEMSSKEHKLIMKTLMNLWGPAYLLQRQELLGFKILRMVNLSIKYGNSIESALAYAFFGFVLSAQLKDYKKGCEFADLGLRLNKKLQDKSLRSKTIVIAEGCVAHWGRPLHEMYPSLQEGYNVGIETNDIIYAGYSATFMNRINYWSGKKLSQAINESRGFIQFAKKINSIISYHQMLPSVRIMKDLAGVPRSKAIFGELQEDSDHLNEILRLQRELNLDLPLANYYASKTFYHTILDEDETALEMAEKAIPYMGSVPGLLEWVMHFYLRTLLMVRKKSLSAKEQKEIKRNRKLVNKWVVNNAHTFGPMESLLDATALEIKGKVKQSIAKYKQTIAGARASKMTWLVALSSERLAKVLFKNEQLDEGQKNMHYAMTQYHAYGAQAKVVQLRNKYRFLVSQTSYSPLTARTSTNFDMETLLKSALALSSEINLEPLIEKLMDILIKNAGAQNAYLIFPHNGKLYTEAKTLMEHSNVCEFKKEKIEDVAGISKRVVLQCYGEMEDVIVNIDAGTKDYNLEPQFLASQNLSILCLPIISKNHVKAIIYMDNRIASSVFTADNLRLLKLLSSQIAISIDNALLYQNMEERVRKRTETIELQKDELKLSMQRSDALLLNILPEEIAEELKEKGNAQPRRHESVTIMFTDFEKFTQMSASMSPEALVEIIDHQFKEFDKIIKKHGLEKIKTMGDAYMAASGLPNATDDHALKAVKAAKEIRDFVDGYIAEREKKNEPYCNIRIGLNTGTVVAGVVGSSKFAYDIWGDTVNTASRMEAAGAPGKINISDSTYQLIKGKVNCEYRGEIEVKNKGAVKMFFVND